jgi:hypothetical protein
VLDNRRVDAGAKYSADVNVGHAYQLLSQAGGKTSQPDFAGRVGCGKGVRHPRCHGDDIDQGSSVLSHENRQHGASTGHRAKQIYLDRLAMQFEWRVVV